MRHEQEAAAGRLLSRRIRSEHPTPEWDELLRLADLCEPIPNGFRYAFGAAPALEERLQAFTTVEKQCFFEFRVSRVGDRVEMTVTAPATYGQTAFAEVPVRLGGG